MLVGGSLLYLLVAPALHLVFRAICKADHNAFRLLVAGDPWMKRTVSPAADRGAMVRAAAASGGACVFSVGDAAMTVDIAQLKRVLHPT